MRQLRRLLWVLLALAALLAVLALFGWLYLGYELQRAPAQAQQVEAFFREPARRPAYAAQTRPCANQYPLRKAWFGALHIHTAASFDATAFGVTSDADDAYAFARGRPLALRLQGDPEGAAVPVVSTDRPLDFAAVTDHAGQLGERRLCYNPASAGYNALLCRIYRGDTRLPFADDVQPLVRLASQAIFGLDRSTRVCGDDGSACLEEARSAWTENRQAAERWQDSSDACEFSTFPGYEYTLAEQGSNLHRNVIFASATVPPAVVSAKDKRTPEALWGWLQDTCRGAPGDCDVITIPHNSNWSSGRMWFPYSLRTELSDEQRREFAALRQQMEPLVEIMQVKGDSECRNGLATVFGEPDELCDFEKLRAPTEPVEDCGDAMGSGNMRLAGCLSRFSYARYALSAGLAEQALLGSNPFRMGIIAATDNHNGAPTAGSERNYLGASGTDRELANRLRSTVDVPGGIARGSPVRYNPGGLAGIWAEENSRAALFAGMRRRETFGTSGPRIEPRFFAGWSVADDICEQPDMIERAYATAVPMGGELPPAGAPGGPRFVASASRDARGGLLQQIQVIKGWVDASGRTRQAIYEIAGNARNGAMVDSETCAVSGPGFDQLCGVWQDPDFDPNQSAVYYARVVENPSCRWSTYQCNTLPAQGRPASCSDPAVPKTIQERAWTSPIWYSAQETQLSGSQT
jgi:hypothetical protein